MAATKQRRRITTEELVEQAGSVFTPTAPIDEKSLFAGRKGEIRLVLDAVSQRGQHAIIFGERGVGKTSLANVLSSFLVNPAMTVLSPRINCDGMDTYETIWHKVFDEIEMHINIEHAGFARTSNAKAYRSSEMLKGPVSPDSVRRLLTLLSLSALPILIIDEFDRLQTQVKRAFADTVKNVSDHGVAATIILVGVADSVDQLIEEHESVERALVQIKMPRMSTDEIEEIVKTGLKRLKMTISKGALDRIVILVQGLPHYAHLLGLYSARVALAKRSRAISVKSVEEAIDKGIDKAQQSIRTSWHRATMSPRKDNLFAHVLVSCALAKTDELGYFAAQDVRGPMSAITGRQYEIPSFAQHLNDFCEEKRDGILQKKGGKRRQRFRFDNPLMQPFVIMKGFSTRMLDSDVFDKIKEEQG